MPSVIALTMMTTTIALDLIGARVKILEADVKLISGVIGGAITETQLDTKVLHRESKAPVARCLLAFQKGGIGLTRPGTIDYGQTLEVLGMTQFTPFGGGQQPLDRPWDDPDLWKKG